MYGIQSKKPWTVMTTSHELATGLAWRKACSHTTRHPSLDGKELKKTEEYTPQMVQRIHDCFYHITDGESRRNGTQGWAQVTLPQNKTWKPYQIRQSLMHLTPWKGQAIRHSSNAQKCDDDAPIPKFYATNDWKALEKAARQFEFPKVTNWESPAHVVYAGPLWDAVASFFYMEEGSLVTICCIPDGVRTWRKREQLAKSDGWFCFFGAGIGGEVKMTNGIYCDEKYTWYKYDKDGTDNTLEPLAGERLSLSVFHAPPLTAKTIDWDVAGLQAMKGRCKDNQPIYLQPRPNQSHCSGRLWCCAATDITKSFLQTKRNPMVITCMRKIPPCVSDACWKESMGKCA